MDVVTVVTTNSFTSGCESKSAKEEVKLLDGKNLARMIVHKELHGCMEKYL